MSRLHSLAAQLHKQKKGWSGYTGVVMYGVRQESGQHSQHQREKQQQPGWWYTYPSEKNMSESQLGV